MHSLNTLVHIASGIMALTLGLFPLLSRKGGGIHRLFGWLFVAGGTGVLGAALAGILFWPQPGPLIMATVAASYQFVAGLRALARFRAGPGGFDALLAVAALVACACLLSKMTNETASWPPAIGYSTIAFLTIMALYDLSRHLWARTWRAYVRPVDHGLKMTGAYFAMMSAGAGNLLRQAQPWSQIVPTVIGLIVMVLLLVTYIRDKRGVQGTA